MEGRNSSTCSPKDPRLGKNINPRMSPPDPQYGAALFYLLCILNIYLFLTNSLKVKSVCFWGGLYVPICALPPLSSMSWDKELEMVTMVCAHFPLAFNLIKHTRMHYSLENKSLQLDHSAQTLERSVVVLAVQEEEKHLVTSVSLGYHYLLLLGLRKETKNIGK